MSEGVATGGRDRRGSQSLATRLRRGRGCGNIVADNDGMEEEGIVIQVETMMMMAMVMMQQKIGEGD